MHNFLRNCILAAALLLVGSTQSASAQSTVAGSEFYVGLPYVSTALGSQLRLVATSETSANLRIEFLDNGDTIVGSVSSDEGWEVTILRQRIEFDGQREGRTDRVLWITSDAPIRLQAYHDASYFSDGWNVPPVSRYGNDYRLTSIWSRSTNGGIFLVVAPQDDTQVLITPTVATASGQPPGFTYGITLNRGEAWQVVPSRPEFTDMTGSRIESDKPVHVVGGHAGSVVLGRGATNPLLEGLPESSELGFLFHPTSVPERDSMYVKVVAVTDNTEVYLDEAIVATLDAAESAVLRPSGTATIESSKPVTASQMMYFVDSAGPYPTGDPSMTTLQPFSGWSNRYDFRTPNLSDRQWQYDTVPTIFVPWQHGIQVAVPDAGSDSIFVDGADISGLLTKTHSDARVRSGFVPLTKGDHTLVSSKRASVQMVGYSHYDAYYLAAGISEPVAVRGPVVHHSDCASTLDTTVSLWNLSNDTSSVSRVAIHAPEISGFAVRSPSIPFEIAPGSALELPVSIEGIPVGSSVAELRFYTAGDSLVGLLPIELTRPLVSTRISSQTIDFGELRPGDNGREGSIWLYNEGDLATTADSVETSFPFALAAPEVPFTVAAGDSIELTFFADPTDTGTYSDTAVVGLHPCHDAIEVFLAVKRSTSFTPVLGYVTPGTAVIPCPQDSIAISSFDLYNPANGDVQIDSMRVVEGNQFRLNANADSARLRPGDTIDVQFEYSAAVAGDHSATIRVYFGNGFDSIDVEVLGRRDSVGLELPVLPLDLGSLSQCADSLKREALTLTNSGNVPIDSVSFSFAAGLIRIDALSGTGTIEPGAQRSWSMSPERLTPGTWYDTILVSVVSCGLTYELPCRYEVTRPNIEPMDSAIDVGSVDTCESIEELSTVFSNSGSQGDSIRFIGGSVSGIEVSYPDGSYVPARDSIQVQASIPIPGPGSFQETLLFETVECGDTIVVRVSGLVSAPSYALHPAVSLFDDITSGSVAQHTLILINNGTAPLDVSRIEVTGLPDSLRLRTERPIPTTVASGDSLVLSIDWIAYQSDTGEITVHFAGDCPAAAIFRVQTTVRPMFIRLSLPDMSANVDRQVGIPVLGETASEYEDDFEIVLTASWDGDALLPSSISLAAPVTANLIRNELVGDQRNVQLRYRGPIWSGRNPLFWIESLVLLGSDDRTDLTLTLDSIRSIDPNLQFSTEVLNGSFRTLGICTIDGNRFIRIGSDESAQRPVPNPARHTVSIPMNCSDVPESVTVSLYNGAGRLVTSSIGRDLSVESGDVVIDFNVTTLPDGLYHYRVEGPACSAEGQFMVVQ